MLRGSYFLVLCFLWLDLVASPSSAQTDNYTPPQELPQGETRAEKMTIKSTKRALDLFNEYKNKHGKELSQTAAEQKDKRTLFGHKAPERNPLDKYGGHLPLPLSWHEYIMDSLTLLKRETMPQCLEPRLVAERNNFAVNILNPAYAAACKLNCEMPFVTPPGQDWKVISYYWPEYVVGVNKAGAQMFDVQMFDESREQDLYRAPTQFAEDGRESQELQLLKQMGVPTELFENPDWHKAPREYDLQMDEDVRFPGAIRPNAFWRAANKRPARPLGWKTSEECLFNALDLPTSQKKIMANRFDQGLYALASRYPELRRRLDPERYQATTLPAQNILQAAEDKSYQTSLCASWRMQNEGGVYGDLEKLGIRAGGGPKQKDYCLPGGGELSGSMVSNDFMPTLQQDAIRAAMGAIWFGSTKGQLGSMNQEERRSAKFSLYQNRQASGRPRYVGLTTNPQPWNSKLVFADKMQRIYPTQSIGNSDGQGGEASLSARFATLERASLREVASAAQRTSAGQRGSHCFRPEDIPNWSAEDNTSKTEWPLGLALDSSKHYGETRWAVWNQRVLCTCEYTGAFAGCLNLNDGDHDEVKFPGVVPFIQAPPAFEKGIPKVESLATETSKPGSPARAPEGIDLNWATLDTGIRGPSYTTLPKGFGKPPQAPQISPQEFLVCPLNQDQRRLNARGRLSPEPIAPLFQIRKVFYSDVMATGNFETVKVGNPFSCDSDNCKARVLSELKRSGTSKRSICRALPDSQVIRCADRLARDTCPGGVCNPANAPKPSNNSFKPEEENEDTCTPVGELAGHPGAGEALDVNSGSNVFDVAGDGAGGGGGGGGLFGGGLGQIAGIIAGTIAGAVSGGGGNQNQQPGNNGRPNESPIPSPSPYASPSPYPSPVASSKPQSNLDKYLPYIKNDAPIGNLFDKPKREPGPSQLREAAVR